MSECACICACVCVSKRLGGERIQAKKAFSLPLHSTGDKNSSTDFNEKNRHRTQCPQRDSNPTGSGVGEGVGVG